MGYLAVVSESSLGLGTPWIPGMLLAQIYVIFFISLAWSARRLPERVTTQFGITGRPQSQMTRKVYLIFISIFGAWLPLWGLAFHLLSKNKPGSLHLPNQAYWLAPEHLAATQSYLLAHWLWFACAMGGFIIGLHLLIVRANREQPARLPWLMLLGLLAYLGAAMTVWSVSLPQHFKHIPVSAVAAAASRMVDDESVFSADPK